MGVYVHDLIITRTIVQEINSFMSQMWEKFKMSDLDMLNYDLRIEVR